MVPNIRFRNKTQRMGNKRNGSKGDKLGNGISALIVFGGAFAIALASFAFASHKNKTNNNPNNPKPKPQKDNDCKNQEHGAIESNQGFLSLLQHSTNDEDVTSHVTYNTTGTVQIDPSELLPTQTCVLEEEKINHVPDVNSGIQVISPTYLRDSHPETVELSNGSGFEKESLAPLFDSHVEPQESLKSVEKETVDEVVVFGSGQVDEISKVILNSNEEPELVFKGEEGIIDTQSEAQGNNEMGNFWVVLNDRPSSFQVTIWLRSMLFLVCVLLVDMLIRRTQQ